MPDREASSLSAPLAHNRLHVIWSLAWPQLVMMCFHFLIGFVDVYVAGLINRNVQASLGLISSCLFFMLIVGMSIANGSVAAISQSVGAGLTQRAYRYGGMVILLAGLGGVLLMVFALFFRDILLLVLQVPEAILPVAGDFLLVYALLLPSYYLLVITNAVFRAHRNVLMPLYAMTMVTVVNTVADFGFGLGYWNFPVLGHKGLAWATFLSVSAGACVNIWILWRRKLLHPAAFPPVRWMRAALPYLFKVAWPSGLTQILWQSGYLMLFAITASLPAHAITALAGMTAGLRVESLLFLPGVALSMTASVLVGNALGQGNPAEAKRVGLTVWGAGVVLVSVLAFVVWQFIEPIAGVFSADAPVQAEIINYMWFNILAVPFTLTSMILSGALGGAGATWYSMWTFGLTVWGLRLPVAYILGHYVLKEATGVWTAQLLSQIVQSTALLLIFIFCDWQRFSLFGKKQTV